MSEVDLITDAGLPIVTDTGESLELTAMTYDPIRRWTKELTGLATVYSVEWSVNGVFHHATAVSQSSGGDSGGYATDFDTGNTAGYVIVVGDVIAAVVTAVNGSTGEAGPPMLSSLTIAAPTGAPGAPQDNTLTLT